MRGSEFADLKAFAEVAGQGSFVRAAERLRVSPSTLSQTIRSLEVRLGVTLLNRTTRRVSLTGAGTRLLERFAPAITEIEAAVHDAREQHRTPRGLVRLHAPRAAYDSHIRPALGRLRADLPEVALDLTVDDSFSDFVADGFDVIVQREEWVHSGVVAVPLGGALRHRVVATPEYLAANGTPVHPFELHDHQCIGWRRPLTQERFRWRFCIDGAWTTLAVSGSLVTTHSDVAVDAAVAGLGIAYVLEPFVRSHLDTGRLTSLLDGHLPCFDGWRLCYPKQRRVPAAVLAMVDVLAPGPERAGAVPGLAPVLVGRSALGT